VWIINFLIAKETRFLRKEVRIEFGLTLKKSAKDGPKVHSGGESGIRNLTEPMARANYGPRVC